MRLRRGSAFLATVMTVTVVATGCSQQERLAEGPSSPLPSASATATASPVLSVEPAPASSAPQASPSGSPVGLFYKDTRVCVTNKSNEQVFAYNKGSARQGETFCFVGSHVGDADITGTLFYRIANSDWSRSRDIIPLVEFAFDNPAFGLPSATINGDKLRYFDDEHHDYAFNIECDYNDSKWQVPASVEVKRTKDSSDYKEFVITVHPFDGC